MSCTLFNISENDTTLVGYNFDWFSGGGKIWFLPASKRRHGYFITTRFGRHLPYEGMNDRGLYVCQTAVPVIKSSFSFRKKWAISTGIIIKIMERCATLDEALTLFDAHSIIFGATFGLVMAHFMIVEPTGKSAVIEFLPGGNRVFRKEGPYQIITNYYLSDPSIQWPNFVPGCGGYGRYETAESRLKGAVDISPGCIFEILKDTAMNDWRYDGRTWNTVFSNVHNLNTREINIVYKKNYGKPGRFLLDEELWKGIHCYNMDEL